MHIKNIFVQHESKPSVKVYAIFFILVSILKQDLTNIAIVYLTEGKYGSFFFFLIRISSFCSNFFAEGSEENGKRMQPLCAPPLNIIDNSSEILLTVPPFGKKKQKKNIISLMI